MSLLPPLRMASRSSGINHARLLAHARPLQPPRHRPLSRTTDPARRYAATSSSSTSTKPSSSSSSTKPRTAPQGFKTGSTVQSVDTALADLQKQQTLMRKTGRMVDLTAVETPVLDPTIEPPFKISRLFRRGGRRYGIDRFKKVLATRQFLDGIIRKGGITKRSGTGVFSSIWQSILCLRPSYKAGDMLQEADGVYAGYNRAQAEGNEAALRQVATGAALESARKVAAAGRGMRWELLRTVSPTKVLSAKVGMVDPDGKMEVGQVVVKFDTEQALTTRRGERKQQRVVEHYVLERHLPPQRGWRLKQKVDIAESES